MYWFSSYSNPPYRMFRLGGTNCALKSKLTLTVSPIAHKYLHRMRNHNTSGLAVPWTWRSQLWHVSWALQILALRRTAAVWFIRTFQVFEIRSCHCFEVADMTASSIYAVHDVVTGNLWLLQFLVDLKVLCSSGLGFLLFVHVSRNFLPSLPPFFCKFDP